MVQARSHDSQTPGRLGIALRITTAVFHCRPVWIALHYREHPTEEILATLLLSTESKGTQVAHRTKYMPSTTGESTRNKLALCWGSMEGVEFTEFVTAASNAGFDAITINSAQFEDACKESSLQDVQELIKDNGLFVSDIDPLFNWLPSSPAIPGDDLITRCTRTSAEEIFQVAHALGSDLVNAPLGMATPESEQEIIDCFGLLCDKAAKENLRVCLEFMPFNQVSNLATAARIVEKAGCENGGIMLDCWHLHRSGGTPGDILSVPGEKFFAMQIDDALPNPMEDILDETLNHRRLPGEGCIDLPGILRNLQSQGAQLVYDVEVFQDSLRHLPTNERARLMFESTRSVVNQL
jgi:sugar phosphate isomerase/epimerase